MFLPLFRGATLVMVNQSSQKDPFQLLDVIKDRRVSVVQATPTTFEMLFATGWKGDKTIDFLVGGEAFRLSILPLAENCKTLRNVYGPTETTIWSSSYTLPRNVTHLGSNNGVPVIPIGMPISQTVFYIVTEDEIAPKRLVQMGSGSGSEGELWIGGVGVAAGYLNALDLTKEKFIPNPFGPGFVYRTGDIVTRLQEGAGDYVFVRRMDDQIKIDGFRIELAEIENVFLTHELVEKSVAVVRAGKLVVYIKAFKGVDLTRNQLRAIYDNSARSLTYYMMPKSIVQVLSFPETANGKLDRKALPDPVDNDLCEGMLYRERENNDEKECLTTQCNTPADLSEKSITFPSNLFERSRKIKPEQSIHHRNISILSKHICDTVEKLRGRRPTFGSSFASIGVDSLGAVMFVKYLSDTLGGIRIEPAKLYAPGITVRSFAENLLTRLEVENPAALEKLGIGVINTLSELEEGGIESLLPSARDGHGNNIYFSHGDDENMDRDGNGDGVWDRGGYSITEDSGSGSEDENLFHGADEVQRMENSFEEILTSNRSLIEGIRGIFTFFVLYDHFHNPRHAIASAFSADTYLFIMISGFTTSLQLRESPRFIRRNNDKETCKLHQKDEINSGDFEFTKNPINNCNDENVNNISKNDINDNGNNNNNNSNNTTTKIDNEKNVQIRMKMQVQMNNSCQEENDNQESFISKSSRSSSKGWFSLLKNDDRTKGLKLQQRKGFRILPFIISRCVGLLPILWLALILNIPPWLKQGDGVSSGVKVSCTALYIIGMQSWWRPTCHYYGPNNVLYASILLNCFIIYSLGRSIIIIVQNYVMMWASEELSPISLKPPKRILRNRSWQQWVGDKMIVLSFNRTDMPTMFVMLLFWLMAGIGLFTLMLFFTFAKNALTFIPYFLVGVMAAAVIESIHSAFWDWGQNHQNNRENHKIWNQIICFMYRVYNHSETESSWPWVHDSKILSYFYISALSSGLNAPTGENDNNGPIKAAYSPLRVIRGEGESMDVSQSGNISLLGDDTSGGENVPTQHERTFFFNCCCNIWRFFPDLTSISIGFLMSTLGDLNNENIKFILWFIIIPTAFLILIIVSMLQKGSARYNFSRFFLECTPITTLGYTSYAMYLFQRIAFTFYLPYLYFGIKTGHFDVSVGDPNQWFERLPTVQKFLAVIILTFLCFLVHKYFQDKFVTHWYAKIMLRS